MRRGTRRREKQDLAKYLPPDIPDIDCDVCELKDECRQALSGSSCTRYRRRKQKKTYSNKDTEWRIVKSADRV